MSHNNDSRYVKKTISISPEIERFFKGLSEDFNRPESKFYSLCIFFGACKWIELEQEARFACGSILNSPDVVSREQIKNYIMHELNKFKKTDIMRLTTMKQLVKANLDDDVFLSLMSEIFNGREKTKVEVEV